MNNSSPEIVKDAVREDLRRQGLKNMAAAVALGISVGAFRNLMSKDQYFSEKQAEDLNWAFQYRISFLTRGEGGLYGADTARPFNAVPNRDLVVGLSKALIIYKDVLALCKNVLNECRQIDKTTESVDNLMTATAKLIDLVAPIEVLSSAIPFNKKDFDDALDVYTKTSDHQKKVINNYIMEIKNGF